MSAREKEITLDAFINLVSFLMRLKRGTGGLVKELKGDKSPGLGKKKKVQAWAVELGRQMAFLGRQLW